MKNFKISILLDSVFIFISSFFLIYAIIRYNGVSFVPSLIFSVLLSLLLSFIFLVFTLFKKQNSLIKESEKSRMQNTLLELCFMNNDKILNLFLTFYKNNNIEVEKEKNYLILKKYSTQVFFNFTLEKTTTTDIIKFYKNTRSGYKTIVIANEFSTESLDLEKDIPSRIKLYNFLDAYLSLKESNLLPKLTIPKSVTVINKKDILKGIFAKTNGKKALMLGVVILLSSRFSFYPIYYIIFGFLMIILSISLRFWGKQKEPTPKGIESF